MSVFLERVAAASSLREYAQEEWEESLREACHFHSLRQVAVLAGVSHARVSQIVGPKP